MDFIEEMNREVEFFSDKLAQELSLFWVMELGPMVSSAICHDTIVYNSTITGKIFAIDVYKKKINWQKDIGSPFGILIITL